MMTTSNGNIFRVTGPLCGEFTGVTRGWLGYILWSAPPPKPPPPPPQKKKKNGSVNSRGAVYLRHNRTHDDVNVVGEKLSRLHCYHTFFLIQGHIQATNHYDDYSLIVHDVIMDGAERQSGTHTNAAGESHTLWSKLKTHFHEI